MSISGFYDLITYFFSSKSWQGWLELFLISYFSLVNGVYLFFILIGAYFNYKRYHQSLDENETLVLKSNALPEILFVVPMYNEADNIISSLMNIVNLSYRYKKIIAVNDGSTDNTLEVIQEAFDLVEIPKIYEDALETKKILRVFQSKKHPEIILIDKENGGKADAVNAAVNAVTAPFFVVLDADTYLDSQGFEKLVRPILVSPKTIGVGASIRLVNGCNIEYSQITTARFPDRYFPAMQAIEYLRAFFLRDGYNIVNANYIVSGAFGIFPRDLIIKIGGLSHSIGEDVELIIRLHRAMKEVKEPYDIKYLPDPIAWTVAPEKYKVLEKQRIRWHRGLLESVWQHKKVLFNPRYGFFGVLGLPFFFIGEGLEPLVEIAAWVYVGFSVYQGSLDLNFFFLLLVISFGLTSLYSLLCLLIEELTFRKYPSFRSLIILFLCNFAENLGYRQMTLYWRFRGFLSFFGAFRSICEESLATKKRLQKFVADWKKNGSPP